MLTRVHELVCHPLTTSNTLSFGRTPNRFLQNRFDCGHISPVGPMSLLRQLRLVRNRSGSSDRYLGPSPSSSPRGVSLDRLLSPRIQVSDIRPVWSLRPLEPVGRSVGRHSDLSDSWRVLQNMTGAWVEMPRDAEGCRGMTGRLSEPLTEE